MSGTAGRYQIPARICADQRSITGLETAIVLIASVVVAPGFAFPEERTGRSRWSARNRRHAEYQE